MALTDNLISYWKFEENAASTDVDDAHSTNDGTASVNTSNLSVTGKIDNGFQFNGTSEYVTIPNTIGIGSGFSFSFWARTSDLTVDQRAITSWSTTTANQSFVIWMDTGGTADGWAFILKSGSTTFSIGTDDASATANTWQHVVATWNGGTDMKIYVDGSLTDSSSSYSGTLNARANIRVGRMDLATPTYYNGEIDEVGVWSRELTSDEVTSLYNSGNGLAYPFTPSATKTQINIGDTWKTVSAKKINIGDAWKDIASEKINIGDAWKTIW